MRRHVGRLLGVSLVRRAMEERAITGGGEMADYVRRSFLGMIQNESFGLPKGNYCTPGGCSESERGAANGGGRTPRSQRGSGRRSQAEMEGRIDVSTV